MARALIMTYVRAPAPEHVSDSESDYELISSETEDSRQFAYQPQMAEIDIPWWRTEMWAYVHVCLSDPEDLAKKTLFAHDKDDLLSFVKAYVHEDVTLYPGVTEDGFMERLTEHNYETDSESWHLVRQVVVHSSDRDFRGPLMMLYWHDDVEHINANATIHAFADTAVLKDWSINYCPLDVRDKLVAAAEKGDSVCFPPSANHGVFTDGACFVCDCPIEEVEDSREGDGLSLLLNDMTSLEPLDRGLFLTPGNGDSWSVEWEPALHQEMRFRAKNKEAAKRYYGGIFKKQVKQHQGYRMIKGMAQRFDRIEAAIERLTGEMRFLPPAHGGAEYWKTSRRFGKGYRSE